MITKWPYIFGLVLLIVPLTAKATHIVGGELNYACLGNGQYEISLTIYRDCYLGNPNEWFDDPASVGIFDSNSKLIKKIGENGQLLLKLMGNDTLQAQLPDPCLVNSEEFCVHTTTYLDTLYLPYRDGGYQLAYQRCCRNSTIQNIVSPLETGATYVANITEEALLSCNTSAKFNNWPPIVICIGEAIEFDHSALDVDGDSLVYSLCTPFQGANQTNPNPQPPSPPPYNEVIWKPPFDLNNVLGGVPLAINQHTGLITGTPNSIGQFVVGVCVSEFRDGELLSVTKRDFQYNIQSCSSVNSAFFAPVVQCDDLTVDFLNQSSSSTSFFWDFGDESTASDTSYLESPTYTYPDTGTYIVRLIAKQSEFCQDTMTAVITLKENGLIPDFSIERLLCRDTLDVKIIDLSQDTISNIHTWTWTLSFGSDTIVSMQPNPTFSIYDVEQAFLSLALTSEDGCEISYLDTLTTHLITHGDVTDSILICKGDSVFLNPNPIWDYEYFWTPSEHILSDSTVPNPLAQPQVSTLFKVKISNEYECEIQESVFVEVVDEFDNLSAIAMPNPIFLGEKTSLEATFYHDATYAWSPIETLGNPNIYNPEAQPIVTTIYRVIVNRASPCPEAIAEVEVEVISLDCDHPYVFVPNVFSPNSDGMNDILFVRSNIVAEVNFKIFNRWGEIVFETNDFNIGWDGSLAGRWQPSGVFAYILTGRCINGKEILQKGNITLLR